MISRDQIEGVVVDIRPAKVEVCKRIPGQRVFQRFLPEDKLVSKICLASTLW
jgi:hypothetical protein